MRLLKDPNRDGGVGTGQASGARGPAKRRGIPTNGTRPQLRLIDDVAQMLDRLLPVVAALEGTYALGGVLVRVRRGDHRDAGDAHASVLSLGPLSSSQLVEAVARQVQVMRCKSERDGAEEWVPGRVPAWLAKTVLQRGLWPGVPELRSVGTEPVMTPDGRVLDRAGFHAADGVLLDFPRPFPPVPETPSRSDAREAAGRLLDWSREFPFNAPCDTSALLAAILTAVARRAVPGPAPMFVIRATAPGTGKTLLAHVLSVLGTGHAASPIVFGDDESSTRKAILSIGLGADGIVLLDNVEGTLGSAALAAALTSRTFTDRRLKVSRMEKVDLGGLTWVATGNNVRLKGDLGRRVIPIDLDAQIEHPEDRCGFQIGDLLAYITHNRARLVVDALTVLRAYHVAGRPRHGGPRIGSFEAWDDLIRGAVIWAGMGDPAESRQRIRKDGDVELEGLRALLDEWELAFDRPVTTGEAVAHAEAARSDGLRNAIGDLTKDNRIDSRALAYALRKLQGRIANGRRLVRDPARTKDGHRWAVQRVPAAGADGADARECRPGEGAPAGSDA